MNSAIFSVGTAIRVSQLTAMRPAGEGDARAGPDDPHVTEIFAGTEKSAAELNQASLAIEMRNDFEPGAGTMTNC
jgi:hypothetical protein